MSRVRRVAKELADINGDTDSGITARSISGDDLTKLVCTFVGPPETPFAGGLFEIHTEIPDGYPFRPPIMRFKTKIWHPNVSSQTGAICIDTLKNAWSPVLTIKTAVISIVSLLQDPVPSDPQDAEVAKMLLENPQQYRAKAHEWAVREAGATYNPSYEYDPSKKVQSKGPGEREPPVDMSRYIGYHPDLVNQFVNMGFDLDKVVEAFAFFEIPKNNGRNYTLEEAYMGDVVSRLCGEP